MQQIFSHLPTPSPGSNSYRRVNQVVGMTTCLSTLVIPFLQHDDSCEAVLISIHRATALTILLENNRPGYPNQ